MKSVRPRFLLGAAAVLVAAMAAWMQRGPWLNGRLRGPVSRALSAALGRAVSVDSVGGGLDGWLWLRGVRVGPGPVGGAWDATATASAVGLKLDVWGLVTGRAGLESLRAVRVVSPSLYLFPAAPAARPPQPAPAPGGWRAALGRWPLAVPVRVEEGSVWGPISPTGRALWMGNIQAALEGAPARGWRLRASGRPGAGGAVAFSGGVGPGLGAPWFRASAQEAGWPPWIAPPRGLAPVGGRLSGTLEARSAAGANPPGWSVAGRGRLSGAVLAPAGRPGIADLSAGWTLRGSTLVLGGIRGTWGGGVLTGGIRADAAAGTVAVTVEARAVDLGAMASTAGAPPDLGLAGPADLDLSASGPLSAPAATLDLSCLAARWRGHPLRGLALHASGGAGLWRGRGILAWDGGSGSVDLAVQGGRLSRLALSASQLPADWLGAWLGPGIAGRVDGKASYAAGGGIWQARLGSADLVVRGWSLPGASFEASGTRNSARVRVAADPPGWAGLNASAGAEAGARGLWTLGSLRIYARRSLLAAAHGVVRPPWEGAPAFAEVTVTVRAVAATRLLPALARDGWKGTVGGRGFLRLDAAGLRGAFRVAASTLGRGPWAWPGSARVRFGPDGVSVTALSLRGRELRARARAPGPRGPWSFTARLRGLRLAALAGLGSLPADLSGTATGVVALDAGPPQNARLDLKLRDPLPARFPGLAGRVAFEERGTLWRLKGLDLRQGGRGRLTARGQVDLGGPLPWAGEAQWSGVRFRGKTFDGEARVSGGGGGPGRLDVPRWTVSGAALPPVTAVVALAPDGPSGARGSLGAGLEWSAQRSAGRWSGNVRLTRWDPGVLAGPWLGKPGDTGLRLDGTVEGSLRGLTRVAGVRLALRDGDAGLTATYLRSSGTASTQGSFRGIDLGRLAAAGRVWGLSPPPLKGRLRGGWIGTPGAATLTAESRGLTYGAQALGPASLVAGWDARGIWVAKAVLGPPRGPALEVDGGRWARDAAGWAAHGGFSARRWPVAVVDVDTDAVVRVREAHGTVRWRAQLGLLRLGTRAWKGLHWRGSWDGTRYSLADAARPGAFSAAGSIRGGVVSLDGLTARAGSGRGSLSGSLGPQGVLRVRGASQGLPAADLAGLMGWPQDWTGSAWGTLKVGGRLGAVHTVVSAKVENGSVDGLPFDLAQGTVVQDGEWVYLSPLGPVRVTRRDGMVLEVGGKTTLLDHPGPGQGMDVWARSVQGGLGLFSGLPAIRSARGPLSLNLRFRGDPGDPRVDGSVKTDGGALTPAWLLPPLERVQVLLHVRDSRASLPLARAREVGTGQWLSVVPDDPLRPAFVFKDWLPERMNLRLRAPQGVQVVDTRDLGFVNGLVRPDLAFTGSWNAPVLSGTVHLEKGGQEKAVVRWPPRFKAAPVPGRPDWFDRVDDDLVVQARSDVLVRTAAAEVFVDTGPHGIRVRGAGGARELYGKLGLTQGSVDYLLATFRLTPEHPSWLQLRGAQPPELDLWGLDDLGAVQLANQGAPQDVQILLHAWGPLEHVQMRLVDEDDPSKSQDDLATLLGLGGGGGDPRYQGGFTRMLGAVPARLLQSWGRKAGILDEVGLSVPAVDQAVGPTPMAGAGSDQIEAVQAAPSSATARSLLEVSMGKYVGSKVYVGMNTELMQHTDPLGRSQINPEVGGVVEYSMPGSSRLSVEHNVDTSGLTDNRVMLEESTRFENYNPNLRRWGGTASPTPQPTPQPSPTPTPTPTPVLGLSRTP